jgi:EAL domain-containing protein (putative c-di-GMP-specific phosphodiesterase class I)
MPRREDGDYTPFRPRKRGLAGGDRGGLTGRVLEKDDMSRELVADIRDGGVFALFQPLMDLTTGEFVGAEALCRWSRVNGAAMRPDLFIALAESTGVVHQLGRFMLDACLREVDRWRAAGHRVEVSVNVSPVQLSTPSFFKEIAARLERRVAPTGLTIEITEALPLPDLDELVPRLGRLRDLGVGISLDDFGSGHTSLDQLEQLPLTEVKFDRSLLQDGGPAARQTLTRAVEKARDLGLRTVAEGIETVEHLGLARELGCDRAQGFHLGAPMRPTEVDAILMRSS